MNMKLLKLDIKMSNSVYILYTDDEDKHQMVERCKNVGLTVDQSMKVKEFDKFDHHQPIIQEYLQSKITKLLVIRSKTLIHSKISEILKFQDAVVFGEWPHINGYCINKKHADDLIKAKDFFLAISRLTSDNTLKTDSPELSSDINNQPHPKADQTKTPNEFSTFVIDDKVDPNSLSLNIFEYLYCENFQLPVSFQIYLDNIGILLSCNVSSLQLHNIVNLFEEKDLTIRQLFYYYLFSMLADWYLNKDRAISSSKKFKNLVMKVDCSQLIIQHFSHLNNILIFYGSVDKYQIHELDDWDSKNLITGSELVTNQIPNPIGKNNWLFLTNMPVKLTPKYTIQVISNRPHFYQEIIKLVPEAKYFDGTNYPSYAKLVNDAVKASPTEIVIIMGDKVRPTQDHIKKMISLICQGYAFVALYNFAFFGFKKELFRQIGYFDERFVGGGYEDVDFRLRMAEANVPTYMHMEVQYNSIYTSWNYERTRAIFFQKWTISEPYAIKNFPDIAYDGLLGSPSKCIWYNTNLTFSDSDIYSGPSSWDSPKLLHLKIISGYN